MRGSLKTSSKRKNVVKSSGGTRNDEPHRMHIMEKAKLEFVAKITMPDGEVIEKVVEASEGVPTYEDFDFSTKEGFLTSFDAYEKATLDARNRIAEEITKEYLAKASKKNQATP